MEELIKMLLGLISGNYLDQRNAQTGITSFDALKGSQAKGIIGAQPRYQTAIDRLNLQQAGITNNPVLDDARRAMEARTQTPVAPPARPDASTGEISPDNVLASRVRSMIGNSAAVRPPARPGASTGVITPNAGLLGQARGMTQPNEANAAMLEQLMNLMKMRTTPRPLRGGAQTGAPTATMINPRTGLRYTPEEMAAMGAYNPNLLKSGDDLTGAF